jgi:hypothetical protein
MGCSPPRSPIHEVDAVLAGGRATATTNSCTGNRDKAPRKCSQFLELIGSVAVAVPADYTRYMNQPCVYMEKVGETVKFGWERHPRRGTVGPPQESEMVDPSRCTITCSPFENASTFSESIARHWLCGPLGPSNRRRRSRSSRSRLHFSAARGAMPAATAGHKFRYTQG